MNMMQMMTYRTARNAIAFIAACWLLAGSTLVEAQQREFFGQIQELNEFEEFLIIDGERIPFDRSRITLFYRGQELNPYNLIPGTRIRYNLHSDGFIRHIHMLSPSNVIEMNLVE